MSKFFTVWLIGLFLLALRPTPALWFWAAAPVVLIPLWLLHSLMSTRD